MSFISNLRIEWCEDVEVAALMSASRIDSSRNAKYSDYGLSYRICTISRDISAGTDLLGLRRQAVPEP